MTVASSPVADRTTTRSWELDLSLAGKVYSPKQRPANRKRQKIARFVGRDGTIERFTIKQTIPFCGCEVSVRQARRNMGR
jgi:hypothetical protein